MTICKTDKMKISQYIDQLGEWDSDDRERYLRPLLAVLSPVSLRTLRELQCTHFAREKADYPAFVKAQNEKIIMCLNFEMASIGITIREELGLEPLMLDTEIAIEPM